MSQPTEGPQPQRTWTETLDWLASQPQQNFENLGRLAALEKEQFDRLIKQAQKVPFKDKVNDKVLSATVRVQAVFDRETQRLSDMAERLQSQAGQYLNAGREWADQQVQAAKAVVSHSTCLSLSASGSAIANRPKGSRPRVGEGRSRRCERSRVNMRRSRRWRPFSLSLSRTGSGRPRVRT